MPHGDDLSSGGRWIAWVACLALIPAACSPAEAQIFDDLGTQEKNLLVWIAQGGPGDAELVASMYARFFACGLGCRVMRLDDTSTGMSMIVRVQVGSGGAAGLYGSFAFVDHGAKQINVLPFMDVALGDAMVRAEALDSIPTITLTPKVSVKKSLEEGEFVLDCGLSLSDLKSGAALEGAYVTLLEQGPEAIDPALLANCFDLTAGPSVSGAQLEATGKTRTFTVYDLRTWNPEDQPTLELEAHEYRFKNHYETDMIGGLGMVPPEALEQMPDLKFLLQTEGTTWVAPAAPGSAEVSAFFAWMALGLLQNASHLQQATGQPDAADMTAGMTANMAAIASKGMPLLTTTSSKIVPSVGEGSPAAAILNLIQKFLPQPGGGSTSSVMGIGVERVGELPELPVWMDYGWRGDWWTDKAKNPAGYEVRFLTSLPEFMTDEPFGG